MNQTQQATPGAQTGQMSIGQMHETAMNVIYNVSSIVVMPVEMLLRPQYGTRYFPAPIAFFSLIFMILLSTFFGIVGTIGSMIPFVHISGPSGMFGLGSITQFFFLGNFIHGFRTWRLMIHPEREMNSTYEGPPLPFFRLIPKAGNFWLCRICIEPAFVFVASLILGNMGILQPSAVLYFEVSALMLAMKQYVSWYQSWSYIRNLMDMKNAGPQIAKLVDNTATEEELAQVHLASFPKNLSPDIRKATVAHIAKAFSFEQAETPSPAFAEMPSVARNPESGITRMGFLGLVLAVCAFAYFELGGAALYRGILQKVQQSHLIGQRSPFGTNLEPLPTVAPAPPPQPTPAPEATPAPAPPNAAAGPAVTPPQPNPAQAASGPAPTTDPIDAGNKATGYMAKLGTARLLPRVGPAIKDISGSWLIVSPERDAVVTFQFDLKQNGDQITGVSRKQYVSRNIRSLAVYNMTGTVRDGGTMFSLKEGPMIQSNGVGGHWCVMSAITLVTTPRGTLSGRWEAPPCQGGTIELTRR
jgi:hypothetical protein